MHIVWVHQNAFYEPTCRSGWTHISFLPKEFRNSKWSPSGRDQTVLGLRQPRSLMWWCFLKPKTVHWQIRFLKRCGKWRRAWNKINKAVQVPNNVSETSTFPLKTSKLFRYSIVSGQIVIRSSLNCDFMKLQNVFQHSSFMCSSPTESEWTLQQ